MTVWSKTQNRRRSWRQPSPCISYKPGEEPTVFTPNPKQGKWTKAAGKTAKEKEAAARLLRRIQDMNLEDRGLL